MAPEQSLEGCPVLHFATPKHHLQYCYLVLFFAEDKNSLLTRIHVFHRQYINTHYRNKFHFFPKSFDFSLIAVTFYLFPARRDFVIHIDFSRFRVMDIELDFLRFQTLF
jgi:hypothetical protein